MLTVTAMYLTSVLCSDSLLSLHILGLSIVPSLTFSPWILWRNSWVKTFLPIFSCYLFSGSKQRIIHSVCTLSTQLSGWEIEHNIFYKISHYSPIRNSSLNVVLRAFTHLPSCSLYLVNIFHTEPSPLWSPNPNPACTDISLYLTICTFK